MKQLIILVLFLLSVAVNAQEDTKLEYDRPTEWKFSKYFHHVEFKGKDYGEALFRSICDSYYRIATDSILKHFKNYLEQDIKSIVTEFVIEKFESTFPDVYVNYKVKRRIKFDCPIIKENDEYVKTMYARSIMPNGKFTEFLQHCIDDIAENGIHIYYSVVEYMPVFPNGDPIKWVNSKVVYPAVAKKCREEGIVYVEFIVEKDGSVTDAKVIRGVSESLDNEAIRVVKSMPKWKPGKARWMPVRVACTLPVNFKL